jgi:UDP-glucose 4-epimerase
MKICLLGGSGFVGKNLLPALLKCGHIVNIFDYSGASDLKLDDSNQVNYVQGNFNQFKNFDFVLEDVEVVYHLISTTLPDSSNLNPALDITDNVVSTLEFLEIAKNKGVKKIIFFSSGGTVYGQPEVLPISESHPTNPRCSYGIHKLTIEKYLALYCQLYGLDYTILRVSNPYGPHQNIGRNQGLISATVYRIQNELPIEIWGDGSVIRDYLHIQDVVNAGVKALNYEGPYKIFNISSGKGRSINEVIQSISNKMGKKIKIIHLGERSFDVKSNILSNDLARRELGWAPLISMDDYIDSIK